MDNRRAMLNAISPTSTRNWGGGSMVYIKDRTYQDEDVIVKDGRYLFLASTRKTFPKKKQYTTKYLRENAEDDNEVGLVFFINS